MPFMFENLQVYQKAVDLADSVPVISGEFPRGFYFLVDQLNRAALSIATKSGRGKRSIYQGRSKTFLHDCPRFRSGMCTTTRGVNAARIYHCGVTGHLPYALHRTTFPEKVGCRANQIAFPALALKWRALTGCRALSVEAHKTRCKPALSLLRSVLHL